MEKYLFMDSVSLLDILNIILCEKGTSHVAQW